MIKLEKMKIRKATKKDFKEIAEILIKESSKKHYKEKYTFKKALKEIRKLSKKELYVSKNEKEIMGFIASSINLDDKKRAYIDELWLKLKYQKKGIGKEFMDFIEDKYKKKSVENIRLTTKRNAKALKFYKKINYKEYKEFVFMEKKLR